jgi:hypothetical protein
MRATQKDGVVITRFHGAEQESAHPSYQAWTYVTLLNDFNEAVYSRNIVLQPCAYLHNYESDAEITSPVYAEYLREAPLFFKGEAERKKLQAFIARHLPRGDLKKGLYELDKGRIRPSKGLVDALIGMIQGNREFVLIDDQKARPAHRHMPWRRWLGRVSDSCRRPRRTPAPMRRRHRRPILTVRGQYAMIPSQVHPRLRHQRRKARHQIQDLMAARRDIADNGTGFAEMTVFNRECLWPREATATTICLGSSATPRSYASSESSTRIAPTCTSNWSTSIRPGRTRIAWLWP